MRCIALLILLLSQPAESVIFTEVLSGETPQAVVVADYNSDGRQDLAFANAFDDSIKIHLQSLSGEFPVSHSIEVGFYEGVLNDFPRFMEQCDVNHDGFPDLTVLCSGDFAYGFEPCIQTMINLGNGDFAPLDPVCTAASFTTDEFPVHFCFGEFTGDHYPDVAVANLEGRTIRIMEGNGSGLYKRGQSIAVSSGEDGPQDLAVCDLNHDGRDDLLAVTSGALLYVSQTSNAVFAEPIEFKLPATSSGLRAVVVDDLDVDGLPDAALSDATGRVQILYGISPAGISAATGIQEDDSLSGCSDIAVVYWDGDDQPDLAVTCRTRNSLCILQSTGGVAAIQTSSSPRRLALGDLDDNGRIDVVTANEGDLSNPSNPDGSIALNLGSQSVSLALTPIWEKPLEDLLQEELPHPNGLVIGDNDNYWVIENNHGFIREVDIEGERKRRIQFDFEVGGLFFTEADKGWVLERFAPILRKFEIESNSTVEYESTRIFQQNPGSLGFAGFAYNPDTELFLVSDPGNERVLCINEDGEVTDQLSISPPAWSLTWDSNSDRLLTVNPGRSDIRAFSSSGVPDLSHSVDLAETTAVFKDLGLAGICSEAGENRLNVLTTTGLMTQVSTNGSVSNDISLSPLSEAVGVDVDGYENKLYILSNDGSVSQIPLPDIEDVERISLLSLFENDPTFIPSGIAVDEKNERILIGDHYRPLIGRLTFSGVFDGFQDFSENIVLGTGPVRAIGQRSVTGDVFFRTRFAVASSQTGSSLSIPDGPFYDFAIGTSELATVLPNPTELKIISLSTEPHSRVGTLPTSAHKGGIAFDGSGNLVQVETEREPGVRIFCIEKQSTVGAWKVYE